MAVEFDITINVTLRCPIDQHFAYNMVLLGYDPAIEADCLAYMEWVTRKSPEQVIGHAITAAGANELPTAAVITAVKVP